MDNMDGTISWTVEFGAGVNINAVTESQFSTSDNAPLTMFSRSGNMVTFVSTHTSDGSITLRYTGNVAMMQTSRAVALTLPVSPFIPTDSPVDFLEGIAESNSYFPFRGGVRIGGEIVRSSSSATGTRSYRRTSSGIEICSTATTSACLSSASGTTYTFASTQSSEGFLLSQNNDLIMLRIDGTNNGGVLAFYEGANLQQQDQTPTFNSVSIVRFGTNNSNRTPPSGLPMDNTATANVNEAEVTYEGNYLVATVPSGTDIAEGIRHGTFEMTIDLSEFANLTAVSGTTTDSDNAASGTFSGGRLDSSNASGTVVDFISFNGTGTLMDMQNVSLGAWVIGPAAEAIVATGRTNAAINGHHAVMGLASTGTQ